MPQHFAARHAPLLVTLLSALAIVGGNAAQAEPTSFRTACAHGLTLSFWTIPRSRPSHPTGWWPRAVSGNRIVMVHEPAFEPAQPVPITMALGIAGSSRLRHIPAGAYPHFGVLQRWQLSWPWLVGVVDSQPLPGPVDWRLWAGNLATGQHIVIDQGRNGLTAVSNGWMRAIPDFDVSDGRVVWTRVLYSLRRVQSIGRIALYDLAHRRAEALPASNLGGRQTLAHPTLFGSRVVWELESNSMCTPHHCPNHVIDLQLYNLTSHHLTTLTHGTSRTGSSFEPGLWGSHLLFLYGYDQSSGGQLLLVDLSRHVPRRHAFWWQGYAHRALTARAVIELEVRDGLAIWDGGMADLAGGGTTRLPMGAEQLSGGHALVLQRNPPAPFVLLRVMHRCSG